VPPAPRDWVPYRWSPQNPRRPRHTYRAGLHVLRASADDASLRSARSPAWGVVERAEVTRPLDDHVYTARLEGLSQKRQELAPEMDAAFREFCTRSLAVRFQPSIGAHVPP
jgi:hypothetical protein